MRRLKNYVAIGMTMAAFLALAIPAAANAAPALNVGGKHIKTPAVVTGISQNTELKGTYIGSINCTSLSVPMVIRENTGSSVMGESWGTGTARGCNAGGAAVTWEKTTVTSLSMTQPGSGTLGIAFQTQICSWSGLLSISYLAGSDSIHAKGPITSPLCGSVTFIGDFDLSIGGVPIELE